VCWNKISPITEQLPVLSGTYTTYFLTPQTHILHQGTQITCNSFAHTMYLLEDAWYKFMPKQYHRLSWNLQLNHHGDILVPEALVINIYSQNDLEKLKNHIIFFAEWPLVLNEHNGTRFRIIRRITFPSYGWNVHRKKSYLPDKNSGPNSKSSAILAPG